MKTIKILALLLATLFFYPSLSTAQENPAAGVEIELVDAEGKTVGKTTTKKDGSWSFKVSSDGDYSLVLVGGLESARMAINTTGTGAQGKRVKPSTQTFTATATLSDGSSSDLKTVSGLESETEIVEFKLELTSDDVSIVSPRDVATGQSSGKRTHSPLKVLKRIDKATPLLYKTAGKGSGSISGVMTYDLKTNTK